MIRSNEKYFEKIDMKTIHNPKSHGVKKCPRKKNPVNMWLASENKCFDPFLHPLFIFKS